MTGEEYLEYNRKKALTYDSLVKKGYAGFFKILDSRVKELGEIGEDGFHCFAGYYDIDNISPNGNFLLYLKVKNNAVPGVDFAMIMVFDLRAKKSTLLTKTMAWCWQQGCRLRWENNDSFIYNDFANGQYITKRYCLISQKSEIAYKHAFYDVHFATNKAFWTNFDRLQANRPGYGYSCGKIDLDGIDSDGLFAEDLIENTETRLISLPQLKSKANAKPEDNHYINHISISPSGSRVMYFHLWAKDNLDMWKMKVYVSDVDGNNRQAIEDTNIVSHYAWLNDDILLLTRVYNDRCDYCFYHLKSGKKDILNSPDLTNDGHPTFLSKRFFISDTYPLENSIQHLFLFDILKNKAIPLIDAFSDPRLYIDKRCDLHPRVHKGGLLINFDTTFKNGLRTIKIIKLEGCYE